LSHFSFPDLYVPGVQVEVVMLCDEKTPWRMACFSYIASLGVAAAGDISGLHAWCFPPFPRGQRSNSRTRKGPYQWYLSFFSGKQQRALHTPPTQLISTDTSLARTAHVLLLGRLGNWIFRQWWWPRWLLVTVSESFPRDTAAAKYLIEKIVSPSCFPSLFCFPYSTYHYLVLSH
jgi:hypothetical protein